MSVIRIPSGSVSALPAFECTVPDGWSVSESPGVLAAISAVDDPSVSILVSAVRVDHQLDLRTVVVRSLAQQRRTHPDIRLDSQRVGHFGDRLTYLRAVTLPGGAPKAQLHALFFAPVTPDRRVADVFSVVATGPSDRVDELGPIFIDLVASFRFIEQAP